MRLFKGHTPGPWVAYMGHRHWSIVGMGGEAIARVSAGDDDGTPPRLTDPPDPQPVAQANAALIAAAPELLAALEAVDRWMAGYGTATQGDIRERIVRAAIAKARGGDR